MSIPDELIFPYYKYCTDIVIQRGKGDVITWELPNEISQLSERDQKRRLAREIIALYHDEAAAAGAQEAFDQLFIKKELPDEIPEFILATNEAFLVQVLKDAGLVASNSEGRRLITQGAVQVDEVVIRDPNFTVKSGQTYIIKAGKRRFLRIVPK